MPGGAERLAVSSTKIDARQQVARYRVEETGLPLAYANLTGGQDELVFDGASFALNRAGEVAVQLPGLRRRAGLVDYADGDFVAGEQAALPSRVESVYRALVVGVRDYIGKMAFRARCWACPAALIPH